MIEPSLDRILQTCLTREADALLVAGSPPLVRMIEGGLRGMQLPPLAAGQLAELIREIQRMGSLKEICGYAYIDINYRNECIFRIALFAHVSPPMAMCMRLPNEPIPSGAAESLVPQPPIYPLE